MAMPLNCFVFQIPALAQAGFRVLAIDMKGYGDSSSPPGELAVLKIIHVLYGHVSLWSSSLAPPQLSAPASGLLELALSRLNTSDEALILSCCVPYRWS